MYKDGQSRTRDGRCAEELHIEELYAEFLLWKHGFHTGARYEAALDEMFISAAGCVLLLELEGCSKNIRETEEIFAGIFTRLSRPFDAGIFGRKLFKELQLVYDGKTMSIKDFGRRCYSLWQSLPSPLDRSEPFDALSWGDEAQTKPAYEKAFAFYNS